MKKKAFPNPNTCVGKFFKRGLTDCVYALVTEYDSATEQFTCIMFWTDDNMYAEPEICFETTKEDHIIFLESYKKISRNTFVKALKKGYKQLIGNQLKALERYHNAMNAATYPA